MISMTNTAPWHEMTGRSRISVDLAKNPKELATRDLRGRTASATTRHLRRDRKPTRHPPKSSAGNHELPDVSPAQFARDFRLTFGQLPSETSKRSAKRLISRSRRRPGCSDPFAAQMQIPAGFSRQGSAEKLTDGEWHHPVARQGPAHQ
jgi:hypothetical protein